MQITNPAPTGALDLRVGELVEVRSVAEILGSLDENGELDALPFMPEMVAYCGRQFRVGKVAHKLCDTISLTGMRRMERAVHLTDVRCDGSAHGGCQAACLIYWKEAWLRRVATGDGPPDEVPLAEVTSIRTVVDLPLLDVKTRKEPDPSGQEVFSCQSTEILRAAPDTWPLRNLGQVAMDVRTGNAGVVSAGRAWAIGLFNALQNLSTRRLPERFRFRGGRPWGFLEGGVADGPTPNDELGLVPGELVRVKSRDDILSTLDTKLRNRGLGFDAEAALSCGQEARVRGRVDRLIDERTGKMLELKNPCILLDGQICEGVLNMSCPRAHYTYFREVWLERVDGAKPTTST